MECTTGVGNLLSCYTDQQEVGMIYRLHSIDRHKSYPTVLVLDRGGQEVVFSIM